MILAVTMQSWACPLASWILCFMAMYAYIRSRENDRW